MFNSFLKLTSICFALLLLPISIMAQELPSSSLYVVTSCYVNEGSSFLDAVEEARATIPNDDNAANMMFFRQPIAGTNFEKNQFFRVVSWNNLQHWAQPRSLPATQEYSCDNHNRTFHTTRVVGTNGNTAYTDKDVAFVSARQCMVKDGVSLSEVYDWVDTRISRGQASRQNDNTMVQMSHKILGASPNVASGRMITIRRIGDSRQGYARFFDEQFMGTRDRTLGALPDAPFEFCTDANLTESYIVHSPGRGK